LLTLHLHQVGWRTFTSKLSNTLGTPGGAARPRRVCDMLMPLEAEEQVPGVR